MKFKSRILFALIFLCATPCAHAVPFGRIENFDKAPLDDKSWRLASGDATKIALADGKLSLQAALDAPRLVWRFYPLRSGGDRPDFGDFRLSMKLAALGNDIVLGLQAPDASWRAQTANRSASGHRFSQRRPPRCAATPKLRATIRARTN